MVEIFSSVKRMFSCPFSACHWRRRFILVRRISFKAGVRGHPFERRSALMCTSSPTRHDLIGRYVQLSGHELLFPERISVNPLPYSFESGFSPHAFQASWPNPVLNPPNFLTSCNYPINDMREIFSGFKSLKIWEWDFLQLGSAIKATWHRNPCWRSDRRQQTALAQLHEGTTVQKQPSVQPSRLTVSSFGQHVSCNRTDGRTKPNNNINRYALFWLLMSLSATWSGTWLCICWRPSPNSRYLKFSLSWPLKYCLQRCDAP